MQNPWNLSDLPKECVQVAPLQHKTVISGPRPSLPALTRTGIASREGSCLGAPSVCSHQSHSPETFCGLFTRSPGRTDHVVIRPRVDTEGH